MNESASTVVVCGKFQPFHVEHLEYVLRAFEFGAHVVIGITNPDPMLTRAEEADPVRSTSEANPFTYYERYLMVKESLRDEAITCERFDIVPFPVNVPEVWFHYVPRDAVFLLTLYEDDKWLSVRKEKLEASGIRTRVLWSKPTKGITGAEVRRKIASGEPWELHTPPAVVRIIRHYGLEKKLRLRV